MAFILWLLNEHMIISTCRNSMSTKIEQLHVLGGWPRLVEKDIPIQNIPLLLFCNCKYITEITCFGHFGSGINLLHVGIFIHLRLLFIRATYRFIKIYWSCRKISTPSCCLPTKATLIGRTPFLICRERIHSQGHLRLMVLF